ncbi:MAG: uridine kinase family protein [Nocardioidaceae bacterium]
MPDPADPISVQATGAVAVGAADEVLARPAALGATRLLAIDGPAGAGKTTIANAVAAALADRGCRVDVLRLDDMYDGWDGLDPALERRVWTQVLQPLGSGRVARWQAYDWHAGAFGEWHELGPGDVLVLEGCGAGACRYAPYTTLLVWVEAPADVRAHRLAVRDADVSAPQWAAWAAAEQRTFAANDTRARAHLRVRT